MVSEAMSDSIRPTSISLKPLPRLSMVTADPTAWLPSNLKLRSHGDLHQGVWQPFIGRSSQRQPFVRNPVALMLTGEQACASGDGVGVGVVLDGAHFTSKLGRRHHVDARNQMVQMIFDLALELAGFLDEVASLTN